MKDQAPPLADLDYELLRRAILDRLGLDFPPHKRDLLRLRLAARLRVHGMRKFTEYYRLLKFEGSDDEWMAVANAVTNNETYFFRERHQFEQLGALAPTLTQRGDVLRVLSAGCSSGEEAYSLAMVLGNVLGGRRPFQVMGVDVSTAKLDQGRRAVYSPRSMRDNHAPPCGVDTGAHLEVEGDGSLKASRALQSQVTFRWTNLADPTLAGTLGSFDIVFCRNVLIYADESSMGRFHRSLEQLTSPGGHLFLGHAESLLGTQASFEPVRLGEHFAYVRAGAPARASHS